MYGSGRPLNPLDIVRAIGNRRHERRIIKRGSSPQIGVVRGHGLIVTGKSRTLQRRDLAVIQDQSPKSGLDVFGSEAGILRHGCAEHATFKHAVTRGVIRVRSKTGDRETDARKQEQRHEQAHGSAAPDEPPSGNGRRCASVLHTVLLSD